jgi:phosphate transport system permease protein
MTRPARAVLTRLRKPWPDHRAERTLGAVALLVCLSVLAMIVFIAVGAWPAIEHNGLSWLGPGGDVDRQIGNMLATSVHPPASAFHLRAWPVIYGTLLTAGMAVALGLPFAVAAAVFIVEFAPQRVRRITIPLVRLLASVPSVVYGLIGVLVLVPFVGNHVISASERTSVENVVELNGAGLLVAALVLTVMITPIMVALITDALGAAPPAWREGAAALGVNRLRAIRAVTLRAVRPAIVAAAVLACARALGEAIMISMVSGSRSFSPKPIDGLVFFFEPLRTLASAIVDYHDGLNAPALHATLYAFALLLLFSALVLSLAGYLIKLPLRRFEVRA